METNEYDEVVLSIKEEIVQSKKCKIWMKYSTFLGRFGRRNRIPGRLDQISRTIDRHGIEVTAEAEDEWELAELSPEKTIWLTLNAQEREKVEGLESVIAELKEEIQARPKKTVCRKFKTFLNSLGIERRTARALSLIWALLAKHGIAARAELDEGWDFDELGVEEKIWFELDDDSVPEDEGPVPEQEKSDGEGRKVDTGRRRVPVDYAGSVEVVNHPNPRSLYLHQEEAIQQLQGVVVEGNKYPFAGLLAIPTGGGKTLTAVWWLLRNYIDLNKKVLWVAHRHELLSQAARAFRDAAYSDVLKNRKSFAYRIVSGIHDKPVNIKPSDDIVVASKDSIAGELGAKYLLKWIENKANDLFLVVDEAHHATAKTYRRLIGLVKDNVKGFRMLGLTATPFRTAEAEEGLLKKVFPDDIIYKVDLRTLIARGILAEPVFEENRTGVDMTENLTEEDWRRIQKLDIEQIGEEVARNIAENRERNNRIVNHYVKNKSKYGQTLLFAWNVDNAIALNALFKEKGLASDFVVSDIRDAATGVTISSRENEATIQRFRDGELEVLINVNICTEGTDLPKVQTVFLTRPTISKILMTQMIGRALRGEKAGGKKTAYIVSFIDDWKDKIEWVNPERLYTAENTDFADRAADTAEKLIRLISIEKIAEFARIMDKSIDTSELEALDFIQRIPIGVYAFPLMGEETGNNREKQCLILVYDNIKEAYFSFLNDLPAIFEIHKLQGVETLDDDQICELCQMVEREYFQGCEKYPGYRAEDIKDVLRFHALGDEAPPFFEFKDRDRFDVTRLAKEIFEKNMGIRERTEFEDGAWEDSETAWKAFFGYDNKEYFVREISIQLEKLARPESFKKRTVLPKDIKEQRDLGRLSLEELREKCPQYWRQLTDQVFARARDEAGYYTCANTGFKSKNRIHFQIDHITPFSRGGLTAIENLQLLTRRENRRKGAKLPQM